MKKLATVTVLLSLSVAGLAMAQNEPTKKMEDKPSNEMKSMKDMKDMKDMDSSMKMNMPMDKHKDMGKNQAGTAAAPEKAETHHATGIVKSVDSSKGIVTLAHAPIKSLSWPAMTMGFAVKDKVLLKQMVIGQKVDVEFMHHGSEYVVTSVK